MKFAPRPAALLRAIGCASALCACREPAAPPPAPPAVVARPPGPAAASYLVAIDTPRRTYLSYVTSTDIDRWDPRRDGWPKLAEWEHATEVTAVRHVAFKPGQELSKGQIIALLPRVAPAEMRLDISQAPYRAPTSPLDATAAIQMALDDAGRRASPNHPVDVVVPPGTYDHAAVLEVGADVRLRGESGVLRATRVATAAVHLAGDRSAALFLNIRVDAKARLGVPDSHGIWVGGRTAAAGTIHDTLVVGNSVVGTAGAHVFGMGEDGGLWAFNEARDGFADTFHHTGGSRYCQVVGNRASGPGTWGDDFYAFIGYHYDGDPVHHCSCVANWGRNGYGRGLSAVGAGFIDFENNDIAGTKWAGVYIAREESYDTYGSFSILVLHNHIADANRGGTHDGLLAFATEPKVLVPSRTFGQVSNSVSDLIVMDNTFADTAPGEGNGRGICVRAGCVRGRIERNTVLGGKRPGIVVAGEQFAMSANVVETGASRSNPATPP